MIEEELRAAFARHEADAPPAAEVVLAINEGYRRRRRGRHLSVLAAAVVAALVGVPSVAVGLSHRNAPAVGDPLIGTPVASAPAHQVLSLLLVFIDAPRPGERVVPDVMIEVAAGTADRSDVKVAFSANPVPADAPIPGSALTAGETYRRGGLSGVERALKNATDHDPMQPIDGGAVVTYAGLVQAVQAIGGVDLHVDRRTTSVNIGHTKDGKFAVPYRQTAQGLVPVPGVTPEVYEVGDRHLAGWQAVDYVRQYQLIYGVHGAGNLRNAQAVHISSLLQAIGAKATNPVMLDALTRIASQKVIFDPGRVPADRWQSELIEIFKDAGAQRPSGR